MSNICRNVLLVEGEKEPLDRVIEKAKGYDVAREGKQPAAKDTCATTRRMKPMAKKQEPDGYYLEPIREDEIKNVNAPVADANGKCRGKYEERIKVFKFDRRAVGDEVAVACITETDSDCICLFGVITKVLTPLKAEVVVPHVGTLTITPGDLVEGFTKPFGPDDYPDYTWSRRKDRLITRIYS